MTQPNISDAVRPTVTPPATPRDGIGAPQATPVTAPTSQPQPVMANKPPVEVAAVVGNATAASTQSAQVLPRSVPQLARKHSEHQKLVRTGSVTRNLYQIPSTLKCAQLAELGKGSLVITIETRAQLNALCDYLKDGPVLKDGTPVHALKLSCDFEKLEREKSGGWVEPGSLLQGLLDSALCVRSLDLGACTLKNEDFKSLSAFLARPECMLEALHLENSFISDAAAQAFARGLENHGSLKTFSLKGACMLVPGWSSVLFALATCKQLETLVIHPTAAGNLPSDVMAYVVANVVTLRTLECSCGPRLSLYPERAAAEWRDDFSYFCQSLAQHPGLVALELKGSELSSADIDLLVMAAEKSGSIDKLGLGTNSPSDEQAGRIGAALARNGASNRRKAGSNADAAPTTTAMSAAVDPSSSSSSSATSASSAHGQ